MESSTRTFEGEPFRCEICGALNDVEVSRPPGDSVCMACGSHTFVFNQKPTIDFKEEIRRNVEEIETVCRSNQPLTQVGRKIARLITISLAAHGSKLYVARKPHWWSYRPALSPIASIGATSDNGVAQAVLKTRHDQMREIQVDGEMQLAIGVPVRRDNHLVGVIEVFQRPEAGPKTREGYLRFVKQMADLVAICAG